MREIEFRGKNKRTGIWVYGSLIVKKSKLGVQALDKELYTYKYSIKYLNKNGKYSICEVDERTIGQYTGLEDRNQNKIFDGDILDHDGDLWIVKYEEDDAMFTLSWENVIENFSNMNSKWFNTIGNRVDNSELLEKGE